MSPLTPDERAEVTDFLRGGGAKQSRLRDLADRLEAKPAPPEGNAVALRELMLARMQDQRALDEAREALREVAEVAEKVKASPDDLMARLHLSLVLPKAQAVLEGVERTHTLIPNAVLHDAAYSGDSVLQDAIANAFARAARGESVTWPTEEQS